MSINGGNPLIGRENMAAAAILGGRRSVFAVPAFEQINGAGRGVLGLSKRNKDLCTLE